jgi:hypothetical protein
MMQVASVDTNISRAFVLWFVFVTSIEILNYQTDLPFIFTPCLPTCAKCFC